jgi:DNA ligase-1
MDAGRRPSPSIAATSLLAGLLCAPIITASAEPPPLALANDYEDADIYLPSYWVSEKYDGVRAYWNGQQLLTRAGNVIHAPDWFTHGWPATAWHNIRFMVFDLPTHGGPFGARLAALQPLLTSMAIDWVRQVPHFRVADEAELEKRLQNIAAAGGEGLMLHRHDSLYRAERSDDLLKLKPYQDAEAQVIGHLPGQGKYSGMLGALLVRNADGRQFRIGTGFTDEQRRHPPAIGSRVTYSYHNLTARGIPRFARFVRARTD